MKYQPFKMPFLPTQQPFNLAFSCLVDSHTDHLMIIEKSERGYYGRCIKDHLALNLMEEHRLWFKEVFSAINFIAIEGWIPWNFSLRLHNNNYGFLYLYYILDNCHGVTNSNP